MKNSKIKALVFPITIVSIISIIMYCSKPDSDIFKMKLGKYEIIALSDSSFEINSSLIKNGDQEEIKRLMPEGKVISSVNTYIIKTGKSNILIDSGIGNSKFMKGKTLELLEKTGLKPGDINLILVTHGHFDHANGLIDNGKAVYPNAKVMLSKKEITLFNDRAFKSLPAKIKEYYKPANQVLKIYKDKIISFKLGSSITGGIRSVDLSGHTIGQSGYLIESEGKKLMIFADLVHVQAVQLPNPKYSLIYDADIIKAGERRANILKQVSSEKILIAGMHMRFPGIGYIIKENKGFSFKPIK